MHTHRCQFTNGWNLVFDRTVPTPGMWNICHGIIPLLLVLAAGCGSSGTGSVQSPLPDGLRLVDGKDGSADTRWDQTDLRALDAASDEISDVTKDLKDVEATSDEISDVTKDLIDVEATSDEISDVTTDSETDASQDLDTDTALFCGTVPFDMVCAGYKPIDYAGLLPGAQAFGPDDPTFVGFVQYMKQQHNKCHDLAPGDFDPAVDRFIPYWTWKNSECFCAAGFEIDLCEGQTTLLVTEQECKWYPDIEYEDDLCDIFPHFNTSLFWILHVEEPIPDPSAVVVEEVLYDDQICNPTGIDYCCAGDPITCSTLTLY